MKQIDVKIGNCVLRSDKSNFILERWHERELIDFKTKAKTGEIGYRKCDEIYPANIKNCLMCIVEYETKMSGSENLDELIESFKRIETIIKEFTEENDISDLTF